MTRRAAAEASLAQAREMGIRVERPCRNNASAKRLEIEDTIQVLSAPTGPSRAGLDELFAAGALRHYGDVAYAMIMMDRGVSVAEIARELAASYGNGKHCCDPVRPAS